MISIEGSYYFATKEREQNVCQSREENCYDPITQMHLKSLQQKRVGEIILVPRTEKSTCPSCCCCCSILYYLYFLIIVGLPCQMFFFFSLF